MRAPCIEPLEARIAPAAVLSIGNLSQNEGDANTTFHLTISLSDQATSNVTVHYATVDGGTADVGTDYQAGSGDVVFNAGEVTKVVDFTVLGNTTVQADRTFKVQLSNPQGAGAMIGASGTATATILDDDRTLSFDSTSLTLSTVESNITKPSSFRVTLSSAATHDVTVFYDLIDGTAVSTATGATVADYDASVHQFSIPAGATSGLLTVQILGDTKWSPDETFQAKLTGATGAKLATTDTLATATLVNDDGTPPTVSVTGPSTASEGTTANFTVSLTKAAETQVTVHYAVNPLQGTGQGLSVEGTDYTAASGSSLTGTLTFAPGETSKTVGVAVLQDNVAEHLEEAFKISIDSAKVQDTAQTVLQITTADKTVTIPAQALPTLSITGASVAEGASGTANLPFTVTLSSASDQDITVHYQTTAYTGANAATAGSDFAAIGDTTLTILAGATTGTINVPVNGDAAVEPDEFVQVALTTPGNANLGTSTALGRIQADEISYQITALDGSSAVTTSEGGSSVSFLVQRSGSALPGTVHVAAVNGTGAGVRGAQAGAAQDFLALDTDVSFGVGETSKTIVVNLLDDDRYEGNEQFTVALSGETNGIIPPAQGVVTVTLTDNELVPTISLGAGHALEGTSISLPVTLSRISEVPITVSYSTTLGTASASDFTSSGPTFEIPAGSKTAALTIATTTDEVVESNETFTVNLTGANVKGSPGTQVPIASGGATATATIDNDDFTGFSIADVAISEGASGTKMATFTVMAAKVADHAVTVNFATAANPVANGATAGVDYTATTGAVTFFSGADTSRTQQFKVNIAGDLVQEADETFLVNLSSQDASAGVTFTDTQAVGTITNDDLGVQFGNLTVQEGNSGLSTALFTVTLDRTPTSGQSVTIHYATADGTAGSSGALADFDAVSGDLTFGAGESFKTIPVQVHGDRLSEPNEAFSLVLSGATLTAGGATATPVTLSKTTATATIIDNDPHTVVVSAAAAAATLVEGSGTQAKSTDFTFNLSTPLPYAVTVTYNVTGGTAPASGQTIVISAGETASSPISVSYVGNDAAFNDQTLRVVATSATKGSGVQAGDPTVFSLSGPTNGAQTVILDDDAKVTIANASVLEGNSGTTPLNFTVTLDHTLQHNVTVNYTTAVPDETSPGTAATPGTDYVEVATPRTVTIAAGQTSALIPISVNGDTNVGVNETLVVNLATPVGANLGTTTSGVGTILNDDGSALGTVTLTNVSGGSVSEGNLANFQLTYSKASDSPVTITYHTVNGSADGSDYTASTGIGSKTITSPPGALSTVFGVRTIDDAANEGDEQFSVVLDSVTNATFANDTTAKTATATITASDLPTISLSSATATLSEGSSGTTNATFLVTLSGAATNPVTFRLATADGTAKAGTDYTALDQIFTIPAGQTLFAVEVPVSGDTAIEGDETFTVNLSLPAGSAAALGASQTVATIAEDDVTFSLASSSDASTQVVTLAEGAGFAKFKVTRSSGIGTASVHYATLEGTANSGAAPDFRAISGDLVFAAGQTTAEINLPIIDDNRHEANESLQLVLSTPKNGILATQSTGTVIITDNDAVPQVTVTSAGVLEGNSGTKAMIFTIALSRPNDVDAVTVNYTTADGTARAGADYQAATGQVVFAPGETTAQVAVQAIGDTVFDSAARETFFLNLSLPTTSTATFVGGATQLQGTGTILDDDAAPIITLAAATGVEGGSLGFVATLNHASDSPVTARYFTTAATASAGDFIGVSRTAPGTITFAPGVTSQQIVVQTTQDGSAEPNEAFALSLALPTGAVINPATVNVVGTIVDDEQAVLSINDVVVQEGDAGTTNAVFHVALSSPSSTNVAVRFDTVAGSAVAGDDFIARTGTLFIPAGSTGGDIIVPIRGDLAQEFETVNGTSLHQESFSVKLSGPINAELGRDTGTGTVQDNDNTPTLNLVDVGISEGIAGATKTLSFLPTLSSAAQGDVTFTLSTGAAALVVGAAQAGVDYVANSATFTIASGHTTPDAPFTVTVNGDSTFENTESFVVRATNLQNAEAGRTTAFGSIYNDDLFASAQQLRWTDTDGELVTLSISQGTFLGVPGVVSFNEGFDVESTNQFGGRTLTQLNLSDAQFLHTNVVISSQAQPGFFTPTTHDGLVNIGTLRSNNVTSAANLLELQGVDLGAVVIQGDLDAFYVGDLYNDAALQSLSVNSLGKANPGFDSISVGSITAMRVTTDFHGNLRIIGNSFGNLNSLSIGGALDGTTPTGSTSTGSFGSINVTGRLDTAVIGKIIGGANDSSGFVNAAGASSSIGRIYVLGDVVGGSGANSGSVISEGSIAGISIWGSLQGGSGLDSGSVFTSSTIGALLIGKNLERLSDTPDEAAAVIANTIGDVQINGSLIQGRIAAASTIGSVTVNGDLSGKVDHQVEIIAGAVGGGATGLTSLTVHGNVTQASVLAGYIRNVTAATSTTATSISFVSASNDAQIGTVQIDGNVTALDVAAGATAGTDAHYGTSDDGRFSNSSVIDNAAILSRIARVIIGGTVSADGSFTHAIEAEQVNAISIHGDPVPLTSVFDQFELVPNSKFFVVELAPG